MNSEYLTTGCQGQGVQLKTCLEFWPIGSVFLSNIALQPDKVATLTLAALCVHNFLREKASDVNLPSAFADAQDENHYVVPGAWRKDRELPSVPVSNARNATTAAKKNRDNLKAYFLSPAGSVSWQENMI